MNDSSEENLFGDIQWKNDRPKEIISEPEDRLI